MKNFEDLSDKEVLDLTESEIQLYIDIELMKAGVVKPIMPKAPKHEVINLKYDEYYAVKVYYNQIVFDSFEKANIFVDLYPQTLDQLYDFPKPHNYRLRKDSDLSIEKIKVVRESEVDKYRDVMSKRKKEDEEYAKLKKEYDKEVSALEEIRDRIWDRVNAAQAHYDKVSRISKTWQEYLDLADQKEVIALGFLLKAFSKQDVWDCFMWNKVLMTEEMNKMLYIESEEE